MAIDIRGPSGIDLLLEPSECGREQDQNHDAQEPRTPGGPEPSPAHQHLYEGSHSAMTVDHSSPAQNGSRDNSSRQNSKNQGKDGCSGAAASLLAAAASCGSSHADGSTSATSSTLRNRLSFAEQVWGSAANDGPPNPANYLFKSRGVPWPDWTQCYMRHEMEHE